MKETAKILLILLTLVTAINASEKPKKERVQQNQIGLEVNKIFLNIEEGINSGNVASFSNYFGDKIYLSLVNGQTGYFSSSQAYYVLKDLFSLYKPLNFKFVSKVSESNTPFASGVLRYSIRGIRSSAMIFVSLKNSGESWIITQITIN